MSIDKHITVGILNDYYGALLTEYQSEIVRLYYDMDMSLSEIAEQYQISRQAVRNVLVRSEEKLIEYEEKLGLVAKITNLAESIRAALKKDDLSECKSALSTILDEVKEL